MGDFGWGQGGGFQRPWIRQPGGPRYGDCRPLRAQTMVPVCPPNQQPFLPRYPQGQAFPQCPPQNFQPAFFHAGIPWGHPSQQRPMGFPENNWGYGGPPQQDLQGFRGPIHNTGYNWPPRLRYAPKPRERARHLSEISCVRASGNKQPIKPYKDNDKKKVQDVPKPGLFEEGQARCKPAKSVAEKPDVKKKNVQKIEIKTKETTKVKQHENQDKTSEISAEKPTFQKQVKDRTAKPDASVTEDKNEEIKTGENICTHEKPIGSEYPGTTYDQPITVCNIGTENSENLHDLERTGNTRGESGRVLERKTETSEDHIICESVNEYSYENEELDVEGSHKMSKKSPAIDNSNKMLLNRACSSEFDVCNSKGTISSENTDAETMDIAEFPDNWLDYSNVDQIDALESSKPTTNKIKIITAGPTENANLTTSCRVNRGSAPEHRDDGIVSMVTDSESISFCEYLHLPECTKCD